VLSRLIEWLLRGLLLIFGNNMFDDMPGKHRVFNPSSWLETKNLLTSTGNRKLSRTARTGSWPLFGKIKPYLLSTQNPSLCDQHTSLTHWSEKTIIYLSRIEIADKRDVVQRLQGDTTIFTKRTNELNSIWKPGSRIFVFNKRNNCLTQVKKVV
jgi:hypothetical protein